MIPLFKSHYSAGRSILTLDDPKKCLPVGPQSIIKIAKDAGLKQIVLLEDNPHSFFEAQKMCGANHLGLVYGMTVWMCNSLAAETGDEKPTINSHHKLAVFIKDAAGYVDFLRLYKACQANKGLMDYALLKTLWTDHLVAAIPFYDSFLHLNLLTYSNCVPDLSFLSPTFFVEKNGLPFDEMIRGAVLKFSKDVEETKTIYYHSRSDADAYMTYRCLTSRSFGKQKTLSRPNLDHFSSCEFCWEAFQNG